MTNYSGVQQDVMELNCELMDIISEVKAINQIIESGWKITGGRSMDPVCGEMVLAGYAEVSKKLTSLAKYHAGVVFYEKGEGK